MRGSFSLAREFGLPIPPHHQWAVRAASPGCRPGLCFLRPVRGAASPLQRINRTMAKMIATTNMLCSTASFLNKMQTIP